MYSDEQIEKKTLASIRAAKRVGATFVEVDVMLSKDKVFFCLRLVWRRRFKLNGMKHRFQ